ncbi:MAG: hypothetical protein J3K34DRAFT_441700 [Monoraphidium minutum]|nr:MAG: hypothetical protein J3K34DRAFT_441700 [Monoraphidium minutum]
MGGCEGGECTSHQERGAPRTGACRPPPTLRRGAPEGPQRAARTRGPARDRKSEKPRGKVRRRPCGGKWPCLWAMGPGVAARAREALLLVTGARQGWAAARPAALVGTGRQGAALQSAAAARGGAPPAARLRMARAACARGAWPQDPPASETFGPQDNGGGAGAGRAGQGRTGEGVGAGDATASGLHQAAARQAASPAARRHWAAQAAGPLAGARWMPLGAARGTGRGRRPVGGH